MANAKGSSIVRNMIYNGKHSLLPPKSPFPSISPGYVDYVPSSAIGPRGTVKPREGNSNHQRTSSESFLMEDQPSWLDELLNEPDTPVRKGGHRRSSSDSFAYIDTANVVNIDYIAQEEYRNKNINSVPAWGLQDFGANQKIRAWDSSLNAMAQSSRDNATLPSSVSSYTSQEADGIPCTATEKQESVESITHDPRAAERKDSSYAKSSAPETDTKRAKQQFAQRSRVRKLQYIAELERNVQALQVEGSEVSAELEFLNQQNLILSMENKALKQRLENLAQEQLIKYMEHEVLEREIGRLRALYQQQQHQPQQQLSSSHRRSRSRDLDSQLANLSLKHKEPSSGHDSVHGSLRT